jgi:hypothetical protein
MMIQYHVNKSRVIWRYNQNLSIYLDPGVFHFIWFLLNYKDFTKSLISYNIYELLLIKDSMFDFVFNLKHRVDDDDDVLFVLDQHAELYFYSASSLKQQFADRHIAPLGHIILIPSQPVFALSP